MGLTGGVFYGGLGFAARGFEIAADTAGDFVETAWFMIGLCSGVSGYAFEGGFGIVSSSSE